MSEIKVNKISPKQTCTQLTLGDSGDTIIIPAGATITNNGTATGFGRTGSVNWDTTPKTTTVTAVSGVGYFVNTTSGAITVNLPAGVAGAIVAVSDYANTAATNNIAIYPNGTDKINGTNENAKITTNGASVTLLYIDSTRGWKDINDATLDVTGLPPFIVATGGTITTCGDYKIHTFTGPGTFTVTSAGSPAGSTTVDYLVVAGGGAGGGQHGAGGGAGGYRESKATGAPWTASPLATSTSLPVSATGYPITVGGGGTAPCFPGGTYGTPGSNSIFSTITSAGGGKGASEAVFQTQSFIEGGSGGGGMYQPNPGNGPGTGNTPPVSPSQGNPGGAGSPYPPSAASGGGGGAGGAGTQSGGPAGAGAGGPGATTSISGTSTTYAGGGGAGATAYGGTPKGLGGPGGGGDGITSPGSTPAIAGTTNRGGGGGGGYGGSPTGNGAAGGSGIVVIRYKFQ
jgi:hypothetical protein